MSDGEVHSWLPGLMLLSEFDGKWDQYVEALYRSFEADFLETRPQYAGRRLATKRYPESQGKSGTFWHLISEGSVEASRLPEPRRCERIRWPRPMIEACPCEKIKVWSNQRGASNRILLALPDFSYVVVLDDRKDFVLLWTAYYVEQSHRREKLRKEYAASSAKS
jgi:hypothetical protein